MNRRHMIIVLIAFALSPCAGAAPKESPRTADASGTWAVTVAFFKGDIKQTFVLKQEGERLSGTCTGGTRDGKPQSVTGTLSGVKVALEVETFREGKNVKALYDGALDGGTMRGMMRWSNDPPDRVYSWTAVRP